MDLPRSDEVKLAIIMVGLPARGKSYTARKLAWYLSWQGYRTRQFNVGEYRRSKHGAHQRHDFFDPENEQGLAMRRELAMAALEDATRWLEDDGDVAIYDATNSTRARRALLREHCLQRGFQVLFIELACDDLQLIEANILATKVSSPDYENVDSAEAVADFRARIAHYEDAYQPLGADEGSYITVTDAGRRVTINEVDGYLPSRLVSFLMNLHLTTRPIWLTRHGESEFNRRALLGGDADLSEAGQAYALSLAALVDEAFASDVVVMTSSLERTIQTAAPMRRRSLQLRALDEIDAGICDGMTYAEVKRTMPTEYEMRKQDKLRYRYPRGESYEDVISRLQPVIMEIERTRAPIVVVGHQAVLRALYAYFVCIPRNECPHLSIPLHTVIQLTPHAYGCDERRVPLPPQPADAQASSS